VDIAEIGRPGSYDNIDGRMLPKQFVAVVSSGANVVSLFKPVDGSPCGPPIRIEGLKRADAIGPSDSDIWVADAASNTLFEIRTPDAGCRGAALVGKIIGGGLSEPRFFVDGLVTNPGNNSVSLFGLFAASSSVRAVNGFPLKGGGLDDPAGIVGNSREAWVANNAPGANSITKIRALDSLRSTNPANVGMPLMGGFNGAGLDRPYGIDIDDNGNLWVTNQAGNSVTVLIGVARPRFDEY